MSKSSKCKKRRVLMLIENNAFPWDRRVLHEAEALQQIGYGVSVICPQGRHREVSSYIEVVNGVTVYRYPEPLQAAGGLGYAVEYGWALLCTSVLMLLAWAREGFDVIHAANPPDIFFLLAWPLKLFGKKYVFDEHDLCPELFLSKFQRKGLAYRLLLWMEKKSYQVADLVISTNQSYRDIARERGNIADERSAIVRNGVDIKEFFRRPSRPELKQGFPYMAAYLGVMGRQDGVDRVVRAAQHVVHTLKRRDVLFLMIGKGECWGELQKLSRELEVDDYVKFVGHVSEDLLLDSLSTADVCLAPDPPDRMNQLSTMTKIMEYMACENPIVSFDLLETRRSAGDAAVYVEGDDPIGFGNALTALLDDPARRQKMAQIGMERSIQLVGLDRSRNSLQKAYRRMLGEAAENGAPEMLQEEPVMGSSVNRVTLS